MKRYKLYDKRRDFFQNEHKYQMVLWSDFDFTLLNQIMYIARSGKGHTGEIYNDCIIMADTETSKEIPGCVCKNYVVAWTISIRAFECNIVTLYGHKPSELIECIDKMHKIMPGDKTIIYIHNTSFDWVFCRKFMFRKWGTPDKQLNTKSHYPLFITFNNGITFKDSLILAQRSIDKWSEDLKTEHRKAVGSWDYNKIRNQSDEFDGEELHYIENDTLSGVECIDATMKALHKRIYSMPYTATGIPREAIRKIGKEYHARDLFKRIVPEFTIQCILEDVYHGGYTHANRHYVARRVDGLIKCLDFNSSYPFCMVASKEFPMERFAPLHKYLKPDFILRNAKKYAFIFKLIMVNVKLKNDFVSMPVLQLSKAKKTINSIEDNGRILAANYVEIYLNEIDLEVIMEQYEYESAVCIDVYKSRKDYLPRWFTDYVFECYKNKCELSDGDAVLKSIAKAKLNSLYGMCCQKPVKLLIEEDYTSGEYAINKDTAPEELYQKYVKKYTSILPYQWGVWVTSLAFRNLHNLGKCVASDGVWLYSDTDSCYATKWDEKKVAAYNANCRKMLLANGYGSVKYKGKEFWLGEAVLDGTYSEFKTMGAKRYCVRYVDIPEYRKPDKNGNILANKLKITVAGVPKKKGVLCLKDDIDNFKKNFVFDGETTGKLQHTYFYEDNIWIDENGNERADSIDLSPTTYILDETEVVNWEKLWEEEIEMQVYDEED